MGPNSVDSLTFTVAEPVTGILDVAVSSAPVAGYVDAIVGSVVVVGTTFDCGAQAVTRKVNTTSIASIVLYFILLTPFTVKAKLCVLTIKVSQACLNGECAYQSGGTPHHEHHV